MADRHAEPSHSPHHPRHTLRNLPPSPIPRALFFFTPRRTVHTLENGGEEAWMKTILKDGTFGDKLAAWMIRVQESPVHRLKALDTLLAFAKKKKREALLSLETLKDLWLVNLLPDRKLIRFAERPFELLPASGARREALLCMWHYEAELKARYQEFVSSLQTSAQDSQVGIRSKVLGTIFELLTSKPEQEKALLALLCNKLGDPDPKVAAKARYLLSQLIAKHPAMTTIVAKEVKHVLNRPNIDDRARYNVICFLNQIELGRTEAGQALAKRLIDTYFEFFETTVEGKELESKMLSALLMGINRAHPFAELDSVFFDKYSDSLFKIIHQGSFNCSVQALLLLCQVLESSQAVSDRFFRALYEKMLDPALIASTKQAMFLNVVFRGMKIDPAMNRVKAYAKRLLQVAVRQPPGFACGTLFLLSEIIKVKPGLKTLIEQAEDLSDDEEKFQDAPDSDDEAAEGGESGEEDEASAEASGASEEASDEDADVATDAPKEKKKAAPPPPVEGYDPKKREPLFAGAEMTCLWELNAFAQHYHPSVVAFARGMLKGNPIVYKGDPMRDFTQTKFLERFVFKKPKMNTSDKGGSLMQPKQVGGSEVVMVNSDHFLNTKQDDVPEDQRFFHKYFQEKAKREGGLSTIGQEEDGEDDDAMAPELADDGDGDFSDDGFGQSDDDDDDDDDPYAALAAGDLDDSDLDEEGDLDLHKIATDGFGEESSEDEEADGGIFASAEDFAQMLEEGGAASGAEKKQNAWDDRNGSIQTKQLSTASLSSSKRGGGKRFGGGGGGGGKKRGGGRTPGGRNSKKGRT